VSGASKSLKRTIDEKVVDGGIVPSSKTIDLPLPQTEEVYRTYEMMRDNDLMELFLGGRRRLMVLIEEEIPERTRSTLVGMGIELDDDAGGGGGTENSMRRTIDKLRKDALSSLDKMMKTNVDSINGVRENAAEVLDTTATTMAEARLVHLNLGKLLATAVHDGIIRLQDSNSVIDESNVLSAAAGHLSCLQLPCKEELHVFQKHVPLTARLRATGEDVWQALNANPRNKGKRHSQNGLW
jgi:hypothetical protein